MSRPRGDALIAMVEAANDAGLDVDTMAAGLGYANRSALRRAIAREAPELAKALRKTQTYGKVPPCDEIIALIAQGFTPHQIVESHQATPQAFAQKLRRGGHIDLCHKFEKLDKVVRRRNRGSS